MHSVLRWAAAMAVALWTWTGRPVLAAQPAVGPMEKLQKLAEQQGHPAAAVTQLRNFGFQATPEMELAAMGIKPADIQAAARRGGSIDARLEAVLKRPLTTEQKRQIADASRQFARSRQLNQTRTADGGKQSAADPQREVLARQVGKTTGIPPKFVLELMR